MVEPKSFWVKAGSGEAINFRYEITPKSKISTLTPNAVPTGTDMMAIRPTWLGALFRTELTKLPRSDVGRMVWEASQSLFYSLAAVNFHILGVLFVALGLV